MRVKISKKTGEAARSIRLSIRTIMILSYLILVVSVALVTAYLSFRNNHRLANMLVMRSARETGLRIQDRITAFFEQPELINAYNAELIERKLINSRAQELLMQHFQKQIKARPTVNSIYYANPEGGLANSGIDKATDRPYVIFTEGFRSGRFLKYALDDSNNRAELLHQIPHFDARNRPWYIRATQSEGIVWSEIYPIATGNDLSITASRAVRDDAQQLIGVLGVDLFLSDISLFLQSLDLEPGAKTIVLDSEGYLVASSDGNRLYAENAETNAKTRIKATDSESSLIRGIAMELNGLDPDPSRPEDVIQFTSKIDDSAFFVSVLPFKAIPSQNWLIVTAIPEASYMTIVEKSNRTTKYLIVLAALLATAFAAFLGGRIARPVLRLDQKIRAISSGEWDVQPAPSHIIEFDDLASEIYKMKNTIGSYIESLSKEIAERAQAQKELALAKEKAEDANRLKSSFLSNMSHELRTPLNGILGFSELLKNQLKDESSHSMAAMIHSSGQRLHKTLDMLLDLSRIEANKQDLNMQTFDALTLVQDCVKLYLPLAIKQGLRLEYAPESAKMFLRTDAHLLQHMLNELISNAIKYTPKGSIIVSVARDDSSLLFSVADTGIGIATDKHSTAFEAFRQVSEGWGRAYEGTGLGLTIAMKYANLLGGEITLESEAGKGSTFTVILPATLLHSPIQAQDIADDTPSPEQTIMATRKFNLLLVDDDPACKLLVEKMLQEQADIQYAAAGKEALHMLEHRTYDAILLDINLVKGLNGTEVLCELRKLPAHRDTPVIALTAYAMVSDRENLLNMGFDAYISKPFDIKTLQDTVSAVCTEMS